MDRINELLERARPELGRNENAFWLHVTPACVEWAEAELDAYKLRKGLKG